MDVREIERHGKLFIWFNKTQIFNPLIGDNVFAVEVSYRVARRAVTQICHAYQKNNQGENRQNT